jgi:hypothetical protein
VKIGVKEARRLLEALDHLRQAVGMVDPIAIRKTVLEIFPNLIKKIKSAEKMLYRVAELQPPPGGIK